jgi:hypothetical protein
MFRIACAFVLLFSIFIVGCGGSGGGDPQENTDVQNVSVAINPPAVTLRTGEQVQFMASTTNATNTAVTWSVIEEIDGGLVTSDGRYTAPSTDGLTCHIKATSVEDPTKYAIALVTISGIGDLPYGNDGVEVRVSPQEVFLPGGVSMQFSDTVLGHSNTAVTWSIDEPDSGTIAQDGTYTAPNEARTVHVRATSQADNTKSDAATVIVIPGGLPPLPM